MKGASLASFSPDGSKIVFGGNRRGVRGTYIVSSQGGKVRYLSPMGNPSWSADGKWIYLSSSKDKEPQIWKIRANGSGEEVRVTNNGGFLPKATFDGKMLYYTKSRYNGGIWRVPVDGGVEEEVKAFTENGFEHFVKDKINEYGAHWAMTKNGIYFLTVDAENESKIKFFDFATESVAEILDNDKIPPSANTSFASNGKDFLFTVKESADSNIMLAELR